MRPGPGACDAVIADFEVLASAQRHIEDMIEALLPRGEIQKTLRQWLVGHAELPEDGEAKVCLMTMAADLELFTPSLSGATAVDRHRNKAQPQSQTERAALVALGAAQFRLVRIEDRVGTNVVRLQDLVTQESLLLLDSRISSAAAGWPSAMRLCPLASGRHLLISPLFALDETTLAAAMKFARPGRPLSHRCAANLYRDVARRGFLPIPQLLTFSIEVSEGSADDVLTEVEHLALRWIGEDGKDAMAELVLTARQLASVDNLLDACARYGQAGANAPKGLKAAFERIAELQIETLVQRARAGMSYGADALQAAEAMIAQLVAEGSMAASAQDLFRRLRLRQSGSRPANSTKSADAATELERVIQRIQALRAKTVERGCTEEEAMAAAAKVAELLARHDLSLDELSVRNSDCQGVSIDTGRKRRAPVDSCMLTLARFCDCHIWSEEGRDGMLRYTLFGLKLDVEAARFLHGLIELTFETESRVFRNSELYRRRQGGERRTTLTSFQVGLATGINAKLETMKTARTASAARSTGFDLVAVKHAVVDEEIEKLGLNLTTRTKTTRRYVHGEAFAAGKAAGALFEPNAVLAS